MFLIGIVSYFFLIKPITTPPTKPLCTGYSLGSNQPASLETTFFVLSLPHKISVEDKMSIDCFSDKVFLILGCPNATKELCEVCRPTNCSSQILYSFVEIKKKIGFTIQDVIKKYEIDKIYQNRYNATKNPRFGPGFVNYTHYMSTFGGYLFAVKQFDNELIKLGSTPIFSYDEEKALLKTLIDYIPSQSPIDPSYLPLNTRAMVVLAIKSFNFNNLTDLKTLSEINITKLEYFCNLSELKYPENICSASNFVIVKEFCGEKLTEEENKIIDNFLSQDYIYLPYKYCKAYFGSALPSSSPF